MDPDYKVNGTDFPLRSYRPMQCTPKIGGLRFEKISVSVASLQSLGTTS